MGQAHVGKVFIHKGPGSKCENCKYFQVCVGNLEPERVYKIVNVRKKTFPCNQYETEMQVVEVAETERPTAVPSKQAIAGAVITFHASDCKEKGCENYEFCFPVGLREGDRCEVLEVIANLQCSGEFPLKKVLLRRAPVS